MTSPLRIGLAVWVFAVPAIPRPAQGQGTPVDTLRWLAGCWQMAAGTLSVEEQWMVPRGGSMLGMSRTVRDGAQREHEYLRIHAAHDTLVYAALPSSQQATEFRVRELAADRVTFENLAHDFPQRIRYRLAAPDLLIASIEGDREGKRQPVVFSYRRAPCGEVPGRSAPRPAGADSAATTPAGVRAALQPVYDTLVQRENAALGAMNSWFAEQADSAFTHVMWTGSGQTVPVGSRQALAAAGERMRLANSGAGLCNRRYTTSIQRLLLRGDTADVLVTANYTWVFADTAGRYGAKGAELERAGIQRRVDRWVRSGGSWRLRQVSIIGEEISVAGRVVARDGVVLPVPP